MAHEIGRCAVVLPGPKDIEPNSLDPAPKCKRKSFKVQRFLTKKAKSSRRLAEENLLQMAQADLLVNCSRGVSQDSLSWVPTPHYASGLPLDLNCN